MSQTPPKVQSPASAKKRAREDPEPRTHRLTRRTKLPPTATRSASDKLSPPDNDDSSSVSPSSEEPSSDDSSADEDGDADSDEDLDALGAINLRANRGTKPCMKMNTQDEPDVRAFLRDFLPKLKAANEELESERQAGTLKDKMMDNAGEEADGQYIEMNLGLGVLEERDPDAKDDESESDDDSEHNQAKDILAKLMGREGKAEDVGIQEVGTAQDTT
jgi:hypothetical protein